MPKLFIVRLRSGDYGIFARAKGIALALSIILSIVFMLGYADVALADENQVTTLSLDEAVELALQNSKALQQAENNIDKAKIERDDAWDTYNAVLFSTHIPGTDMYVSLPTGADPQGLVFKTDLAWKTAQKDCDTLKEQIMADVHKSYFNILQLQAQLEAVKQSLASKERDWQDTKARWRAGMDVIFNVNQKRAAIVAEKANQVKVEDALQKGYADLAQLVGLPEGSSPELSLDVAFQPVKVDNLDQAIDQIIDSSPDIWKAEQAVELQEDTYAMLNSADVDRYNLRNARISADMAKDGLRKGLLGAYYSILDLESAYEAAREGVEIAQEALRIAHLKYEVGMATKGEVLAAEAALTGAKQQLLGLTIQHELAVKAFWQPWAWQNP